MVNYRPQKFLGLLAPTQYARVTRLSPAFRVRVWLYTRDYVRRSLVPNTKLYSMYDGKAVRGPGNEASLCDKAIIPISIAEKQQQDYNKTIAWIRCLLSFSLVRSSVMCLRGARSSYHCPTKPDFDTPLDVALSDGHVPTH